MNTTPDSNDERDKREDRDHESGRRSGVAARLRAMYEERPIQFSLALMGIGAVCLVFGLLVLSDGSTVTLLPVPLLPGG